MKTERVKNSVYNSFSNLSVNISITILSFIVRTVFIKKLGEQCLGLDGLYTNILSLLSLAELGFSSAISFSLYEPLAKNNIDKIGKLMRYFKNIYMKIAITILIAGMCLLPFLDFIVKEYTVTDNIYLIYILYLVNTVSSYLTSYTSILIEADQKNYKLTIIKLLFNILTYGLQLIVLLIFGNFLLYLIVQFVLRLIERIITNEYIKIKYKYINFNIDDELDINDKREIKQNIKGIVFHRVGNYLVNGTDNILISSIVTISATGIYSNYLSITAIFRNLISCIISSTTSSFGNLNVLEGYATKKNAFNLINFMCYFMSGIVTVGLYFCIKPFIIIWIGGKFLVDTFCIIVICINFYLNCIMLPITTVKSSAGLYYVDRYIPIIQALINLGVSIILGINYGLIGILLGTTISSILTVNITKPYVIYKYVFNSSCKEYFVKLIKNIFIIFLTIVIGIKLFTQFTITNLYIEFCVYGILIVLIYIILFILFNHKETEYKYFKNILFERIKYKNKEII